MRAGCRVRQEPFILTGIAFFSIFSGVGLAVVRRRPKIQSIIPSPLPGSVFVLGFALLGVALSHWRQW
jgi:hypothetical protein